MAYHRFAEVYDQLMTHAPYDKWVSFTEKVIEKYKLQTKSIIELGCGTGEITIRLAEKGYNMTGIDLSTNMLTIASNKALERQLQINWLQQDIINLTGLANEQLVISYCDVVNYIVNEYDVFKLFQGVYDSLMENGIFIFDVHSRQYMEEQLVGKTFADVSDDVTYIWDCEAGENNGEMIHYLTFFMKNNDKYDRFDEIHYQQVYPVDKYEKLLKQARFRNIDIYADFLLEKGKSAENSERIFIIAQK